MSFDNDVELRKVAAVCLGGVALGVGVAIFWVLLGLNGWLFGERITERPRKKEQLGRPPFEQNLLTTETARLFGSVESFSSETLLVSMI